MENKKEIMKQVWNDIFNNEHCTCRDFEDYWNWKKPERKNKIMDKETIIIWIDSLEKSYEVNKLDWLKNRDTVERMIPKNEIGWGYSEHEYETHKDWKWEDKNYIENLIEDLIEYDKVHPNSSTTFDNSTIDDLSKLMEKKISKEEFNFRVECVEKCLEDIKHNNEPLRSLFDICIATDLDDDECLDWYEGFNLNK